MLRLLERATTSCACGCLLLVTYVHALPRQASVYGEHGRQAKSIVELLHEVAVSEEPALGELLKRPDAREGVLKALEESEASEVLGSAVLVLGRFGNRARKDLKDILSPKADSPLQSKVLRGLGVIGPKGAWLEPEVRELAEDGLAGIVRRLKDARQSDQNAETRTSDALLTLGYMGVNSKKSLSLVEKFLALEIDEKDDSGMHCQMIATTTLWRLTGARDRALALFSKGLRSPRDGAGLHTAIFGLGEMGEHALPLRPELEQRLSTATAESRQTIQTALDKIDGKQQVIGPRPPVK